MGWSVSANSYVTYLLMYVRLSVGVRRQVVRGDFPLVKGAGWITSAEQLAAPRTDGKLDSYHVSGVWSLGISRSIMV